MKTFMLIIDGMSDDPSPNLNGQTPLEAAFAPHLEQLARQGCRGFVKTAPDHVVPDSLTCIAGLMGCNPGGTPLADRAAFEALAAGIELGESDLAFRCNIVRLADDGRSIEDFTAGAITDKDAAALLARLEAPGPGWEIHRRQSYRNLLVIRDAPVGARDLAMSEPHMHQHEPLEDIYPRPLRDGAGPFAARLRDFLLRSREQLAPAGSYMLWLWSPSRRCEIPAFADVHGQSGAVVAGLDFMYGLAAAARMSFAPVPGATGYTDTDYAAKGRAAMRWFDRSDFVLLHVNATDEAAHACDVHAKVAAIEKIDAQIVGPVIQFLREKYRNDFVAIACGDHKTSSVSGLHGRDPVPYFIYRDFAPTARATNGESGRKCFCENMAGACIPSGELLKTAFAGGGR